MNAEIKIHLDTILTDAYVSWNMLLKVNAVLHHRTHIHSGRLPMQILDKQ
jgi:hypothetical protein